MSTEKKSKRKVMSANANKAVKNIKAAGKPALKPVQIKVKVPGMEKTRQAEPAATTEKRVEVKVPEKKANDSLIGFSVREKLEALYNLQQIDSQIDKIRTVRGELPLEVQDLDDEIEGLETRIANHNAEVKKQEEAIAVKRNEITESNALIKRYENQQKNVRNNREFDSLSKEIEFQNLEIQITEKRIKENQDAIEEKKEQISKTGDILKERNDDMNHKKKELEEIVSETKREEEKLYTVLSKAEKIIEERLLSAYKRIRANVRNGLAVVKVERDACGGCFNKIPPQRQMDIRLHKKIIVCEHCGRILVDDELTVHAQSQ